MLLLQEGVGQKTSTHLLADALFSPQRSGPELFNPNYRPGEWLSEADWTLEGIRGLRAQEVPPRHLHPHAPPWGTSFLQHVGGHH